MIGGAKELTKVPSCMLHKAFFWCDWWRGRISIAVVEGLFIWANGCRSLLGRSYSVVEDHGLVVKSQALYLYIGYKGDHGLGRGGLRP